MRRGFLLAALCAGLLAPSTARAHRYWWGGVNVYDPFWGPPGYAIRYDGPPNRGAIKTDIEPEEARVIVDGKDVGEADDFDGWPGYLILKPGHRHLEFRHKGYKTLVVDVDMRAGWLLKLDDDLNRGDPREKIVRRSVPPARNDEANPDGSDRPRYDRHGMDQDRDGDYEDRDYEEEDRGSSYQDDSQTLHRDGGPHSATGRVRFDIDPADASVYVDGEYRGSARELARGIELSAGDHKVVVTRDGYEDREVSVSVDRGTTSAVSVELLRLHPS